MVLGGTGPGSAEERSYQSSEDCGTGGTLWDPWKPEEYSCRYSIPSSPPATGAQTTSLSSSFPAAPFCLPCSRQAGHGSWESNQLQSVLSPALHHGPGESQRRFWGPTLAPPPRCPASLPSPRNRGLEGLGEVGVGLEA